MDFLGGGLEIFGVYARVLGMVINGFWRKMWRKMFDKLHQSWCVVWFSIGVVAGVVFGLVFRINFLVEWWFFMLVGILFVISIMLRMYYLVSCFNMSAKLRIFSEYPMIFS